MITGPTGQWQFIPQHAMALANAAHQPASSSTTPHGSTFDVGHNPNLPDIADDEEPENPMVNKGPLGKAKAKAKAKAKFKVYPSAYANAFAAKEYKAMGGGWSGGSNKVAKRSSRGR